MTNDTEKKVLHFKTLFAFYLNVADAQMQQQLGDAEVKVDTKDPHKGRFTDGMYSKADMRKLAKFYFPFLRKPHEDWIQESPELDYCLPCDFFQVLKRCVFSKYRNYYSHLYHTDRTLNISVEDKEVLEGFLNFKLAHAKKVLLSRGQFTEKELKVFNPENEHYQWFKDYHRQSNSFRLNKNNKALVFLTCFFLTPRQANELISKTKGLKDTREKEGQAMRAILKVFCMDRASDFRSDIPEIRFVLDGLSRISQMPQEVLEHLTEGYLSFSVSKESLQRTENIILKDEVKNIPLYHREQTLQKNLKEVNDADSERIRSAKREHRDVSHRKKERQIRRKQAVQLLRKEAFRIISESLTSYEFNDSKTFFARMKEALNKLPRKAGESDFGPAFWEAYRHIFAEQMNTVYRVSPRGLVNLKKDVISHKLGEIKKPNDKHRDNAKEKAEKLTPLESLQGERFINKEDFTERVKEVLSEKTNETEAEQIFMSYREHILKNASHKERIRTGRDRMPEFIAEYLELTKELRGIKFRLRSYSEAYEPQKKIKVYHGGKHFPVMITDPSIKYESLTPKLKHRGYRYDFNANGHLPFNFEEEGKTYEGMLSPQNLRELAGLLLLDGKKEFKLLSDLKEFVKKRLEVVRKTAEGASREEIRKFMEEEKALSFKRSLKKPQVMPSFLQKWLSEDYEPKSLKDSIVARLQYFIEERFKLDASLQEQYRNEVSDFKNPAKNLPEAHLSTIRKYDKIRYIINFLNRFTTAENRGKKKDRRAYLDRDQHEKMEKILGEFSDAPSDLKRKRRQYMKNHGIGAEITIPGELPMRFSELYIKHGNLDSLFKEIFYSEVAWAVFTRRELKDQKNNVIDDEYLKDAALKLNVTEPKVYKDNKVVQELAKQFLEKPVHLPKGFFAKNEAFKEFWVEKQKGIEGAGTVNFRLRNLFEERKLKLPEFYNFTEDYSDNWDAYNEFGKAVEEHKSNDRLLALMVGEVLKSMTGGEFSGFRIDSRLSELMDGQTQRMRIKVFFEHVDESGNKINNENKKQFIILEVGFRDFYKVSSLLKRRNIKVKNHPLKVAPIQQKVEQYLPEFINEPGTPNEEAKTLLYYDPRKQENTSKGDEVTVYDLEDVKRKIDHERLLLVNLVMKLELEGIMVLLKDLENQRGFNRKILKAHFCRHAQSKVNKIYPKNAGERWQKIEAKLSELKDSESKDIMVKKDGPEGYRVETKHLLKAIDFPDSETNDILNLKTAERRRGNALHGTLPFLKPYFSDVIKAFEEKLEEYL